ncbi:MAG: hypothetical protein IJJ33_20560 [Victivallales bacterium]|nr:hypothetical protein [Victivallales bacterium]
MKYARNISAAFTWTVEGQCRAVVLERTSGGCRVKAHWAGDVASKASAISEALATARRQLDFPDGTYVVAGATNGGWGMAELAMPQLRPEELRGALAFELRKHTPLPVERLTWGYRVIPEENAGKASMLRVRLFYVKTDVWRFWMSAVAGLGHLDMVAAPAVLLDPVAEGKPVVIPGRRPFRYVPSQNGRDEIHASTTGEDGTPLPLAELFPVEGVLLGSLEKEEVARQQEYLPAILMAMYALSPELTRDISTMPRVSEELRPRRYVALQLFCALLALVCLTFLLIGSMMGLRIRLDRLNRIEKDIRAVETQTVALRKQIGQNSKEVAQSLEEEIARYQFDFPGLPEVLTELTGIIKAPGWLGGGFEWKAEPGVTVTPVTFSLREPVGAMENTDLVTRLNDSPILGDVKETQSQITRNSMSERRFSLNVRYDTETEREAVKRAQAEARRRAQAEKAREKLDKARVVEEDESDDGGDEQAAPAPADAPSAPPAPPSFPATP